jgi:DNA-binding response OmpR family regulator
MEKRPGLLSFPLKKVIIAEELQPVIAKERSFLNRSGIKIISAATNDEALEMHRSNKADLIIAMLKGKGMSGEELCAAVRDDEALRRVSLMLVCSSSEEDRELCLRCRANAFVTTPVSPAVLLQEAHHLLSIAPRESLRTEIDVMLSLSSGKEHYPGRSENISESGMLIASEVEIHEGDTIGCTFELPGIGQVNTNAVVVRASEERDAKGLHRYGIAFIDPSKDMVYAIKVFIRKHRGN